MSRVLFFLMATLCVAPKPANAEGGCPPGQIPNNVWAAAGSAESIASCIPIPMDSSETAQWKTRWGAIASQTQGSEFGIVTGMKSERQAKSAALAECTKRGGMPCETIMVFRNQCAAIVSSTKKFFANGAAYEEEAIAAGKKQCAELDAGECWVYYSGCSLPVRAR